jgi:hypothetical protein
MSESIKVGDEIIFKENFNLSSKLSAQFKNLIGIVDKKYDGEYLGVYIKGMENNPDFRSDKVKLEDIKKKNNTEFKIDKVELHDIKKIESISPELELKKKVISDKKNYSYFVLWISSCDNCKTLTFNSKCSPMGTITTYNLRNNLYKLYRDLTNITQINSISLNSSLLLSQQQSAKILGKGLEDLENELENISILNNKSNEIKLHNFLHNNKNSSINKEKINEFSDYLNDLIPSIKTNINKNINGTEPTKIDKELEEALIEDNKLEENLEEFELEKLESEKLKTKEIYEEKERQRKYMEEQYKQKKEEEIKENRKKLFELFSEDQQPKNKDGEDDDENISNNFYDDDDDNDDNNDNKKDEDHNIQKYLNEFNDIYNENDYEPENKDLYLDLENDLTLDKKEKIEQKGGFNFISNIFNKLLGNKEQNEFQKIYDSHKFIYSKNNYLLWKNINLVNLKPLSLEVIFVDKQFLINDILKIKNKNFTINSLDGFLLKYDFIDSKLSKINFISKDLKEIDIFNNIDIDKLKPTISSSFNYENIWSILTNNSSLSEKSKKNFKKCSYF